MTDARMVRRAWPSTLLFLFAVVLAIEVGRAILVSVSPPVPIDRSGMLIRIAQESLLWLPLIPLLLWLTSRLPITRRTWWWRVPLYVVAGVGFVLAHAFLLLIAGNWIAGFPRFRWIFLRYAQAQAEAATYVAMVAAAHGLMLFRGYRERERRAAALELERAQLEAQLARAEVDALRMQLQPHFLFNTLNAITAFIHEDPDRADRMLTELSELLRMALERGRAQEIHLEDELRFVDCYLDIQGERLGERLCVERDIDPAALHALVPPLILQPLVENAVVHGVAARLEGGVVRISAHVQDDLLKIVVRDEGGTKAPEAASAGFGIGLSNTRARLAQLYGFDAVLELDQREGAHEAIVRLPFRAAAVGTKP